MGESNKEIRNLGQDALAKEEEKARLANDRAEVRRQKLALSRKRKIQESRAEREAKAKELDDLLANCAKFSDILTKKTEVLGRVGSGFDGKTLGEHNLEMAKQPKCMIGGTMRDYQLEGLTWMFEICLQGMSGILADEMGLGKTIQTISLLAKFREDANYMGPHLIIAPLSTLSNWQDEFTKWVPSIPVAFYHGTPAQRREMFRQKLQKNLVQGRVNDKFPVVLTTPEIVIRDASDMSKITWEIIIIDEGHRLKNSDSKLFRILRTFTSVTRFLITGTPLQNNLKELWSLLNFLLPNIFANWEQFESWFDFSDLQDEETTEEFLQDQMKQDLVKKMHLILQPLLLRRIKSDVEYLLPRKREYVLYAPMTKEQTDLYNVINDKATDTRKYLESKVVERLTHTPSASSTPEINSKLSEVRPFKSKDAPGSRSSVKTRGKESKLISPKNAFQKMMKNTTSASNSSPSKKRKRQESVSTPAETTISSERIPSSTGRASKRRTRKTRKYAEAHSSDEELSDEEFEAKLSKEITEQETGHGIDIGTEEDIERAKTLEIAKREIGGKKLGNPVMQLRLTCNSPHNFYNPWSANSGSEVDETIVTSSGKMLLLDRLLPALFERGNKVLIFSQFKTQLDILEDYARELRRWNLCRIDGSTPQEERRQQIEDFNDPDYKLFLLSTRAGGQGINLTAADTVILYDSDWNPQQDLQAQDRVHRIGQKKPVIIFRLATRGTVEEDLLLSADAKRRLEKLVIKKGNLRTMNQSKDGDESLPPDALKALLLKDGLVYQYKGGDQILSDADIETLCDRGEAAYREAEKGHGDRDTFRIVETKASGLMTRMEGKDITMK
ncbi:hypothetical protein K3495_g12293 [Podosphaera aphanis]|nr:hypothetical protein K3495_g12293 [Podosphaera aphanis]